MTVAEDTGALCRWDQRHRLRRMDRGEVSGDPDPVLITPIADNDLAAAQDWTILDRRGNWSEFAETIGVSPVTTTQTRTRNAVNEYQAIDPDGPGPQLPLNLAHDANGNVTLDPTARNLGDGEGGVPDPSGQAYEYDEENRLTAVRRASDNALLLSIWYDAVGRRVSSADYLAAGDPCGGPPALARHIYAALETLEEQLSCGGGTNYALAREFIWGDRFPQPVALITHGGLTGGFGGSSVPPGESAYHYLHDVLGSVVALTNAAGEVVERYTYDPYGKTVIEQTNPATGLPTARLEASGFGNPFAWTGQRYDAGVRLYHFLFRGYSPQLGRWLQRDPLDTVDGINLVQYVSSRPLVQVDRRGLQGDPRPQLPPSVDPPPGAPKSFDWDGEKWHWRPGDPHNRHDPHWDSPSRRLYTNGTIESKRQGPKSRTNLSNSQRKGLRGKGVTLAIALLTLANKGQGATGFSSNHCTAAFKAAANGDCNALQQHADECALDIGVYLAEEVGVGDSAAVKAWNDVKNALEEAVEECEKQKCPKNGSPPPGNPPKEDKPNDDKKP